MTDSPFKETFYCLLVIRKLRYIQMSDTQLYYTEVFYIGADNLSDEELIEKGHRVEITGGNRLWWGVCLEYCLDNRIGIIDGKESHT